MSNYLKLILVVVFMVCGSAFSDIRQTIMPYFHWLYVDFATSTISGHSEYATDGGAKYLELALSGNACYDILIESAASPNPDLIYRIQTSSGEQTLDDDGAGHLQPRALLWITGPTLLKVRAYSSSYNTADFLVYSYIQTTATSATDCGNIDIYRPFYNGATGQIVRGPANSYD